MTIKAKVIGAIQLQLTDGVPAVLVQVGGPWNDMVEYQCVSPQAMLGQKLIVMSTNRGNHFSRVFDNIFGRIAEMEVLMATSELASVLKAIKAETEAGSS